MAAINGRLDIIRLLAEKKADLNSKNSTGDTALMLARKEYNAQDIVEYLMTTIKTSKPETCFHLYSHANIMEEQTQKPSSQSFSPFNR